MAPIRRLARVSLLVRLVPISVLTCALAACGTGTVQNALVGTWTGSLTDSLGQPGTAALTLTEDRHGILQGTFSYIASDCSANLSPVTGKIAGGQISLVQTPPNPIPASLQLAVGAQELNGSYAASNGVCNSTGTLTLTKPAD